MNSIENYKIFQHQGEKDTNEEQSFEQKIFSECSFILEQHSSQFNYLIYCKKTEDLVSHNLKNFKQNSDLQIDFKSEIFQDDFILKVQNNYLVNFCCQNWFVLITLQKNQQIVDEFYMTKRKIQARLENNQAKKLVSEIKDKYVHQAEDETFNEQIYFETEMNTQQNKKIIDKIEEEHKNIKSRKKFLKILLIIGALAFLIVFFGVLCNESYFRKIKGKSLFENRKIFTWQSDKTKKETQKIEKLRQNLFIEDKGVQKVNKVLKKGKKHKFQKTNFDF